MRPRSLLLVLVLVLAATGCVEAELRFEVEAPARIAPVPAGASTDADAVVAAALADIERYWGEHLPDVYGRTFEPVDAYLPYGPATSLPPCGPEPLRYDQIADNALYCPTEDLIAWDRTTLIPDLHDRFGPLTVGLVMAHEYAHAIQARADVEGSTVALELQADCFAGAWVDDVDGRIDAFTPDAAALDSAIAGLLELRDTLGVPGTAPVAHGSGFDRVGAFQEGFEQGPEVCATYEADPPTVVAMPFASSTDRASGGNLPSEELVEPLVADLESFFGTWFAEQGRRWDPVATPDLDDIDLLPELEEIGDFAVGAELARRHAFAAQSQLGVRDRDAEALGLHADCLTGAFAEAEFSGTIVDQQLRLSPGDLDEIIIGFLAFGDDDGATAFERTGALRAGFVDGAGACDALLA